MNKVLLNIALNVGWMRFFIALKNEIRHIEILQNVRFRDLHYAR